LGTNYAVVSKKLTAWQNAIERVPQNIVDQLGNGMTKIAEEGKLEMQIAIRSRGTDYSRSQGRAGRNDPSRNSPDMAQAVGSRLEYVRAGVGARAAFGWLKSFQNWYQFQEEGFTHPLSGRPVEAMYALRDSKEAARGKLHTLGKTITTRLANIIRGA
jgi:hypothetical protein